MKQRSPKPNYAVFPLPLVRKAAKKLLTPQQLREGVEITKLLRFYPDVPELSIERCGEGMELRIESASINQQGWLRAIFWLHEKSRTIYIVDLFWKKTNKISAADLHRSNHRIRKLRSEIV